MKRKTNAYKLAIVGEAGVGKSSIVERIVRDRFISSENSTIGAAFSSYKYNGEKYQIWDTAGQERYQALIPMYLRDSRIVLMIYDTTNYYSLERIKEHWYEFVRNNVDEDCYIVLIGNKLDVVSNNTEPINKLALDFTKSNGLHRIQVSAKEGTNISQIFQMLDTFVQARKLDKIMDMYDEDEYGERGKGAIINWDTLNSRNDTGMISACTGNRCSI